MPNSIRVHSAAEYVIEVNDKGETISFDVSDTSLASKMISTFDKINKLAAEYEGKAKAIEARPDEAFKVAVIDGKEKTLFTKNQYDSATMIDELYQKSRETLDSFLGEGACQKIFGDKNYLNMFNDLAEQLEPHFKKVGLKFEDIKKRAAEKHTPSSKPKVLK
jgi:hypothetical protein